MSNRMQFRLKGKARDAYLECVNDLPLAPLRSDAHLAEAQRVLDQLLSRESLNEGEETYLEVLSDLVAAYEDRRHPIGPASDADLLRHFMEARQISQADLSRDAGVPKSTISEILARKRPFSRQLIRKLATYFGVDVGLLAANL